LDLNPHYLNKPLFSQFRNCYFNNQFRQIYIGICSQLYDDQDASIECIPFNFHKCVLNISLWFTCMQIYHLIAILLEQVKAISNEIIIYNNEVQKLKTRDLA